MDIHWLECHCRKAISQDVKTPKAMIRIFHDDVSRDVLHDRVSEYLQKYYEINDIFLYKSRMKDSQHLKYRVWKFSDPPETLLRTLHFHLTTNVTDQVKSRDLEFQSRC